MSAAVTGMLLGLAGAVGLVLVVTYAPPFQAVFGTAPIPAHIWPWLLAGGLVFFLVVEAEKFIIRSSASLRRTVTTVEAGT